MLTRAGFGDHAAFTHASREQRLTHRIIDLMRAGVQKIFPLKVNLRAAGMSSESLRVEQWCRAPAVIAQQLIEFPRKILICARAYEFFRQLLKRSDQSFRNVTATEFSPMAVLVRLACCDFGFLHRS